MALACIGRIFTITSCVASLPANNLCTTPDHLNDLLTSALEHVPALVISLSLAIDIVWSDQRGVVGIEDIWGHAEVGHVWGVVKKVGLTDGGLASLGCPRQRRCLSSSVPVLAAQELDECSQAVS